MWLTPAGFVQFLIAFGLWRRSRLAHAFLAYLVLGVVCMIGLVVWPLLVPAVAAAIGLSRPPAKDWFGLR